MTDELLYEVISEDTDVFNIWMDIKDMGYKMPDLRNDVDWLFSISIGGDALFFLYFSTENDKGFILYIVRQYKSPKGVQAMIQLGRHIHAMDVNSSIIIELKRRIAECLIMQNAIIEINDQRS